MRLSIALFPAALSAYKVLSCISGDAQARPGQYLVHVYPELSSPLSDPQCEGGVERHSAESDPGVLRAAGVGQDTRDQAELHHGGRDVEHQGRQHKADPPGASVYRLG